jgi:ATP-dependent Zn protease
MILLAVVLWRMASTGGQSAHDDEPNYTNFLAKVQNNSVKDVTIYLSPNSAELQGEYREGGKFRGVTVANTAIPDITKALQDHNVLYNYKEVKNAAAAGSFLGFYDEADAGGREQSPQFREITGAIADGAAKEGDFQGRGGN